MSYLYQQELISFDIEGTSDISALTIIVSGSLFGLLIYYFFRTINAQSSNNE